MKSMQILALVAGLFTVANAWGTDVHTSYTTIVTTAYETYCPSPTTFVHHNVTYTATTATTLTITSPTTTRPVTVPGSGAEHLGAGLGAVALAGLFALLI
ncbi:hypothetical protein COL922a_001045 [Colletotrichum nupharicola]|nr:hypothetical protein COL922a_001045 [Colletotrichum nupharicola]